MTSTSVLEQQLNKIKLLPQSDHIDQEQSVDWLKKTIKWHPNKVDWLTTRLNGLGGSEIGAVLRGLIPEYGHLDGFSSIDKVVKSKLLQRLPEFETPEMRRGIMLEPLARATFLARYKAKRDKHALAVVAAAITDKEYPWLKGNPDDIVIMPDSKRYVVDYKVPSAIPSETPFDYKCQLNHYSLIAKRNGIDIDGLIIVNLDLAPDMGLALSDKVAAGNMTESEIVTLANTIAITNVAGFGLVSRVMPVDEKLQDMILEYGALCWNEMVCKGIVPSPNRGMMTLSKADEEHIGNYQRQYAIAREGVKRLNAISQKAVAAIEEKLAGKDFDKKVFNETLVGISPKPIDKNKAVHEALSLGADESELLDRKKKYSIEALVEEIKHLKGDPNADHLYERVYDIKKVQTFLLEQGYDIASLHEEGVTLRVSTRKADKERLSELAESFEQRIEDWLADKSGFHSLSEDECRLEYHEVVPQQSGEGVTKQSLDAGAYLLERNENEQAFELETLTGTFLDALESFDRNDQGDELTSLNIGAPIQSMGM